MHIAHIIHFNNYDKTSLESLLIQTIARYIFAQRTNVPSEIINAYTKVPVENIFKLCEIIHCVEGINNATELVT